MSFLGKLLGSNKVIEGIMNGADKLHYSAQEKKEHFIKTLALYEPFKLAQRYLAIMFGVPYVLAWFITFLMSFTDVEVESQLELLNGTMGNINLAIIGFYFLGGTLASTLKGNK